MPQQTVPFAAEGTSELLKALPLTDGGRLNECTLCTTEVCWFLWKRPALITEIPDSPDDLIADGKSLLL